MRKSSLEPCHTHPMVDPDLWDPKPPVVLFVPLAQAIADKYRDELISFETAVQLLEAIPRG